MAFDLQYLGRNWLAISCNWLNISMEGPSGFCFGFSLPFFAVAVGLCICMIHGNVCVIKFAFARSFSMEMFNLTI